MAETFFIADLHLGHRNLLTFENVKAHRPFATIQEHDEAIISRWNAVVRPQDTVWVLGDVVFGQANLKKLGQLNGHKKLSGGNHDRYATRKYLDHFEWVGGQVEWHDFILSHVPVHPGQLETRYKMNIHGHLHAATVLGLKIIKTIQQNCTIEDGEDYYSPEFIAEEVETFEDRRYLCVSAEQVNLTPLSSDAVFKIAKERGL